MQISAYRRNKIPSPSFFASPCMNFLQGFLSILNKDPYFAIVGHAAVNFSGTAGRIISERHAKSDRGIVVLFRRSENVRRSAPTSRKLDKFENRGRKRRKMSFVSAFVLPTCLLLAAKIKQHGSNWIVWDCLIPPWKVMRIIWPRRGYCARCREKNEWHLMKSE